VRKSLKSLLCSLIFIIFFLYSIAGANSLWNKDSSSPFSANKSYKVGDIITILVSESTDAQQKAGTDTNIKDDLGFRINNTIQRLVPYIGGQNSALTTQNSNKYTGAGTTKRASNVTTTIASVVTEVMDNGNLKIEGRHKLEVNNETQDLSISGIIRPIDVNSANNSIYSYQVANAEVSVKGTGVVQEAEEPGWFTRIINWFF